jgi:two-component system response regulator GlrR
MSDPMRILLVDDDAGLLRLLSLRLRSAGYEVLTAESGEEALARLPQIRPDLVITDLRMGGMDGLALHDALRKTHPSLPVIILTAHGSIPEAVEATRRGVFGFMAKPFDGKELLAEVARALALSGAGAPRGAEAESWRGAIVTRSPAMEELLRKARLAAEGDASVLVCGESGTGKELLARAIHRASPRHDRAFVPVNCSAIPEPLLESELFGHARGAFTGAVREHEGLFQAAHGGTLFLDEIGDMPLALQAKVLRALQEKEVRPVGAAATVAVDVRVVSATHRDLDREMASGAFREDLYYRLNVIRLEIPPLAARREDIPLLAEHFLGALAAKGRKQVTGFSPEALEVLVSAPWPGNVRQLANAVEQAYTLSTSALIPADLVREALRESPQQVPSFLEARRRFELDYLVRLLQITEGNVTRAARLAGRNRTDFYKLLARHRIEPALFKPEAPKPD